MTTTSLNVRLNNHLSSIRKQKKFAISSHFHRHGIENLEVGILECRMDASTEDLRSMEAYWINRLNTLEEGLNTKNEVDIILNNHLTIAIKHYQHSVNCFPYITHRILETRQDHLK